MFDLPGFEWFRPDLGGSVAAARANAAAAASRAGAHDLLPELERMAREDDAPFVFRWGGTARVGEVRFAAVNAVGRLYARAEAPPALGPVAVRRAMAADEALRNAEEALAALPDEGRESLLALAQSEVAARCRPDEADRKVVQAYRVLQRLGAVPYQWQELDPRTLTTPLQEAVRASQLVSARPRPHVRVADRGDPDRTLGFVCVGEDGGWAVDFAEVFDAQDAEEAAVWVLQRQADGVDPVEGLDAVVVGLRGRFAVELVR
ncbi:MAG: hypothetical protein H6744_03075 [Deltaproteobacteria bacterium]|nr:hypothetical protein [Deltaproteobacteria bacterium]MCB9785657.1 hypothetical protein [Deltaproteobacteria bacterium]